MTPKRSGIGLLAIAVALAVGGVPLAAAAYKDYSQSRIYDVVASTAQQLAAVVALASGDQQLDFFSLAKGVNESSRVLVPPGRLQQFLLALDKHQVAEYTVVVEDVAQIVRQTPHHTPSQANGELDLFERYYRHDEINEYLAALERQYPSRVFLKDFGRSFERRPLKTVTITNGDGRSDKKVIFIDAAVHAREWITPVMVLHVVQELVQNFGQHGALLEDYDWVLLPVVNPDGYEYTHDVDRYWRKTRRPNEEAPDCPGTDGNRNWSYGWGLDEGSSGQACEDVFRGQQPFSEPETQVVRDIMWHYKGRLQYYLSLHSYGNMLLLPWGHTSSLPANFLAMMEVADAGAMAMVMSHNAVYSYGSTHSVIYPTSGDSADYAVGEVQVPVAMAMEMPAGGFSGFDPPVRQIEDIVTETWVGIRAMGEYVVQHY